MSDRVPPRQFREFIFQEICQHLTPKEVHQLAYTQNLPAPYLSKDGTEVLLKLEMLDKFSDSKPTPLAEMMKGIGRKDLAKKVEKYVKKQRQCRSKKQERDSLTVDQQVLKQCQIKASLKIAKYQTNILLEQLEEMYTTAREIEHRSLEDRVADAVTLIKEQLQQQLSLVTTALEMRQTSADSSLEDSFSSPPSSLASSEEGLRSPAATLERPRPRLDAMSKATSLPRSR